MKCKKCDSEIPDRTTWFGRRGYCSREHYFQDFPYEKAIEDTIRRSL